MPVSPVLVRADDIPGSLAEAIQALPGFELYTNGWVEPDPSEYPLTAEVLAGEVGEVEVSVSKLWSGSTQLTFAFHAEFEEPDEDEAVDDDEVICGIAWLFPSIESVMESGNQPVFGTSFKAEGYLHAILENDLLLSVIRLTDEVLGRLLFGNPREFLAMNANYSSGEGAGLIPVVDDEKAGNAFIREFTFMVGAAQPYFLE